MIGGPSRERILSERADEGDALRLLFLVQKPQRRGAEVFASHLAAQFRREGHDLRTVYLYPLDCERGLEFAAGDICLHGAEDHIAEKLLGFRPHLLRLVMKAIGEFGPHVVQANGSRTLKYGALAHRWARHRSWALIYRNIAEPNRWLTG